MAFDVLKDAKEVAAVLDDPTFNKIQQAVANAPNDEAAVAALREASTALQAVYTATIDARLADPEIKSTCRKVI